jgi:hypothetical protein
MGHKAAGGRQKPSYRYRLILERSDDDHPWCLVERITLGEFHDVLPSNDRRSGMMGGGRRGGYLDAVSRWLERESDQRE